MSSPLHCLRPVVVVMGPSGVGKSTIGARLAAALAWPFTEGDVFHPPMNIAKMASGVALSDADRLPWLYRLRSEVIEKATGGVVLSCSALKRMYRDILRGGCNSTGVAVFFVELVADPALLKRRLKGRQHAYMPPTLMASQYAALEPLCLDDEEGMKLSISDSVDAIVKASVHKVREWLTKKLIAHI